MSLLKKYAICLNTILPVRDEASEKSEMVTQLLFGETCEVLEEKKSFLKIKNTDDGYVGWADTKMLSTISESDYVEIQNSPIFRVCVPIADSFCLTDKQIYHLTAGSKLPFYNPDINGMIIGDQKYQIHSSLVTYLPDSISDNIVPTARIFLNAPYLWGGKSVMGIDCSGFTQVVYNLCGYSLPRDASQQVICGVEVKTLDEAQAGDLLFFSKNNSVSHVGIYLGENKIIHASGKVRIDKVDEEGIYKEESSSYTHQLVDIRRL